MFSRCFVLLLILLIGIVACAAFYPQLENSIIFHPQKGFDDNPSNWDLVYESVEFFTPDGERIHGWFFPVQKEAPVFLFCHGNAGNISHRIENVSSVIKRGISVLIFDYRGYGKSSGKPSEKGIYRDGIAAYDYLIDHKKIPPQRMVIFGRSLGGAVAIEVALQREVGCVIIESAFTSSKDMAKTIFPFFIMSPFLPHHYHNGSKIKGISVPKMIVHGDNDKTIPFYMGKRLFESASGVKKFFPVHGAGHNDTYIKGGEHYFDALYGFIIRSLGSKQRVRTLKQL